MKSSDIDRLLAEISAIVALIGSYDEGSGQLTLEGRRRLHRLFELKMQLASAMCEKQDHRLVGEQGAAVKKAG